MFSSEDLNLSQSLNEEWWVSEILRRDNFSNRKKRNNGKFLILKIATKCIAHSEWFDIIKSLLSFKIFNSSKYHSQRVPNEVQYSDSTF